MNARNINDDMNVHHYTFLWEAIRWKPSNYDKNEQRWIGVICSKRNHSTMAQKKIQIMVGWGPKPESAPIEKHWLWLLMCSCVHFVQLLKFLYVSLIVCGLENPFSWFFFNFFILILILGSSKCFWFNALLQILAQWQSRLVSSG